MTVSYTSSYKASATLCAITMLARSASFRTLVGVHTEAAAKAFIVEEWGGTPNLAGGEGKAIACDGTAFTASPPYAIIRLPALDVERIGVAVYRYRGTVDLVLMQDRRLTTETPPESMRRATNVADAIRYEILAQYGTRGCFAEGVCEIVGPGLPDDVGADHDALQVHLTISFEG